MKMTNILFEAFCLKESILQNDDNRTCNLVNTMIEILNKKYKLNIPDIIYKSVKQKIFIDYANLIISNIRKINKNINGEIELDGIIEILKILLTMKETIKIINLCKSIFNPHLSNDKQIK